jgi:hypothetical protein
MLCWFCAICPRVYFTVYGRLKTTLTTRPGGMRQRAQQGQLGGHQRAKSFDLSVPADSGHGTDLHVHDTKVVTFASCGSQRVYDIMVATCTAWQCSCDSSCKRELSQARVHGERVPGAGATGRAAGASAMRRPAGEAAASLGRDGLTLGHRGPRPSTAVRDNNCSRGRATAPPPRRTRQLKDAAQAAPSSTFSTFACGASGASRPSTRSGWCARLCTAVSAVRGAPCTAVSAVRGPARVTAVSAVRQKLHEVLPGRAEHSGSPGERSSLSAKF